MTETQLAPTTLTTFDPRELRRAFGQFATGITVVTVLGADGPHGMTANSFTSVSLDPPLVLLSVDHQRRTYSHLLAAERFAISVLAETHRPWSDRFAGRGADKQEQFADVPHVLTSDGLPLLEGALAHFVCRRYAVYPGGDHALFLGQVEQFTYQAGRAPLLYFGGSYQVMRGEGEGI
jgi:flavin reductase (DIM6/NTAB) family NADH-FMN oxidoreductase RutF